MHAQKAPYLKKGPGNLCQIRAKATSRLTGTKFSGFAFLCTYFSDLVKIFIAYSIIIGAT